MAEAVEGLSQIDRRRCRSAFEDRFTADRMARDYVALYERLIAQGAGQVSPRISSKASRQPIENSFSGRHSERSLRIAGGRHV